MYAERTSHEPKPVPRWWPAQWYYGWALVGVLGVTETASYGVLSYAFAVFITPMSADLGWSKAQITGAFSLGALVAGLAAVAVGHWVDRHGARGLMTVGSLLAAVLLALLSGVRSLSAFYLLWGCMGLAMAAVLYEPAFAVVAAWFRARRSRALTVLTFIAGFASIVFVPLATWLVGAHGWRAALLWLAAIYAAATILPHALVLRRRPSDLGLTPDGIGARIGSGGLDAPHSAERSVTARSALQSPSFRWMALAFALASFATTAISVHLVALLLERGHGAAFAAAAMGVLGLMALPGRLIFTPLGSRWSRSRVTASIFALSAIACAILVLVRHPAAVWFFVVLFGAGFGAITPARAALVAERYGPAHYGRIAGTLALILSFARAAAPVGASLVYLAGASTLGVDRGYDVVLLLLAMLCLGAGVAILRGGDHAAAA